MTEPEPIPIKEQIALAIANCLAGIRKDRQYRIDVAAVKRPRSLREDWSPPAGLSIVLLQGDAQRDEAGCLAGNPPIVAWRQSYQLDLHVVVSEDQGAALDTLLNVFEAEVVRAVMATPQWGGLTDDTLLSGVEYFREIDVATVVVTVLFRHPENDPYTRA